MNKVIRDDIHIISRNSNWSISSIDKLLKDKVYSTSKNWSKFLKLLFLSLGIGFTTAGIIFFFAYNWDDLHRFIKIGLVESLTIIVVSIVVFSKLELVYKNIMLSSASVLVGVLFAVFGQIYQTGANAYDFFMAWTLHVLLWVLISNFAPLWLIFISLINTTIVLYSQQVAHHWEFDFIVNILFFVNLAFLIASLFISKIIDVQKSPSWFSNMLSLGVVSISTVGIAAGIFSEQSNNFIALVLFTISIYYAGYLFAIKSKRAFNISIIGFSLIIISCFLLVKISNGALMSLFVSFFVISSVTVLIMYILKLNRKWTK